MTRFGLITKYIIDAYESAKKLFDALSAVHERTCSEHTRAILDTMLKALTAYDITSGDSVPGRKTTRITADLQDNGYHKNCRHRHQRYGRG